MLALIRDSIFGSSAPPKVPPKDFVEGLVEAINSRDECEAILLDSVRWNGLRGVQINRNDFCGLVLFDMGNEEALTYLSAFDLLLRGFFDHIRNVRKKNPFLGPVLLVTTRKVDAQEVVRMWVNGVSVVGPVFADVWAASRGVYNGADDTAGEVLKAFDYSVEHPQFNEPSSP